MNSIRSLILIFAIALCAQGCVLTKLVTMPMRLGAAVVSLVPGVGNSVHDAIDGAAETVDEIPI